MTVSNRGERVTPDYPNDGFYAHLSIYAFAARLTDGGTILDVGCGTGYGTHYLAKSGGAGFVQGVDASHEAIAYARRRFRSDNLAFDVDDAARLERLRSPDFDLVFSSNVLEHVPDVAGCLLRMAEISKPGGTIVIAVPPCESDGARREMMANPFHLNIWTSRQWNATLEKYFESVEAYRHMPVADTLVDFGNRPEDTSIRETDFIFEPTTVEAMEPSLTAVFVARNPRSTSGRPLESDAIDIIDLSFSRPMPSRMTQRAGTVPVDVGDAASLSQLPRRVHDVVKTGGIRALFQATAEYLKWHAIVRPAQRELGLFEQPPAAQRQLGLFEQPPAAQRELGNHKGPPAAQRELGNHKEPPAARRELGNHEEPPSEPRSHRPKDDV